MDDDFAELENRLRNRAGVEPSTELRDRVLLAVSVELKAATNPAMRKSSGLYWPSAAAAVVLVASLSMISAAGDAFSIRTRDSAGQLNAESKILRQIETQTEGDFR